MSFFELFLLSVGLSMDASAVSVSNTLCLRKVSLGQALSMAGVFAIFQMIMPLTGYYAAMSFSHYITSMDHWIALVLLSFIGGKMIYEGIDKKEEECIFALTPKVLFVQGIATSIDALAVGISLSALGANLTHAVSLVGIVTFLCCLGAVAVAKRFGEMLGKRAELAGGFILILIGIKIFVEHVFLS